MIAFSPLSLRSLQQQPGSLVRSSQELDWHSLLVQEWLCPTNREEFVAPETEDQTIVVFLEGSGVLEAWKDGRWNSAFRACGSVGLTASGEQDRLRWGATSESHIRTAYIYLPQQYLTEAEEAFGDRSERMRLSVLNLVEPTLRGIALGLIHGVRSRAPQLYAETAAVFLATHLVTIREDLAQPKKKRVSTRLSHRRLSRVIEYMHSNLTESISLRTLSREASMSVFHFVRVFKEQTGSTPIQYLNALRIERAYRLLVRGELPIAEIALQCGYSSHSAFSTAVRRQYGLSPAALRRQSQ